MADEGYRAVFLRVHPTGKMVLSLTTESDGNERRYAQQVADELGVPALDVKVVTADENRFGSGHGFNTSPSGGTAAAISSASGKIRAKAQLLASVDLQTPGDQLKWDNGAFVTPTEPSQSRTIADVALYAHGSGALPRASRAASTPRPSTATNAPSANLYRVRRLQPSPSGVLGTRCSAATASCLRPCWTRFSLASQGRRFLTRH